MPQMFGGLDNPALADLLLSGAIGVLPTDTVYGLVCAAGNPAAAEKLYKLKNRHQKPGTIIAASIQQLVDLGIKARYLKSMEQFWPGAITVVVAGQACRVILGPQVLLDLLNITGPLLTTSANQPGEPPANNIIEAQNYFGEQVDFYVNGGDLSGQKPSTLIRIVDDAVEVLREGAVIVKETGEIIQ